MGDQDKIDTIREAFGKFISWNYADLEVPAFDRENQYFLIRKGNPDHEIISDAWDGFYAGWIAREDVPEETVRGW
jgi:hypothetical protein